jgi:alpha-L-rhamnosidase
MSERDTPRLGPISVEHYRTPIGIGESAPRLSWTILDAPRGWRQRAYEIEVVDNGIPTITRFLSTESVLRPWPGRRLRSRQGSHVRVRVLDDDVESGWSDATYIEAGLLEARDWSARFVAPAVDTSDLPRPAWLLRDSFVISKPVQRARLYASALGMYELELNGQRVGSQALAPGWTSYLDRIRYQTYDVDHLLRLGDNVIGGWLADGWYRGRIGFQGGVTNFYGPRAALLVQLEITFVDGTVQHVTTNERWVACPSPITATGLYEGETYDARREIPDWSTHDADVDGQWDAVVALDVDAARLVAPLGSPVAVTERLRPVTSHTTSSGATIYDFAQNIAGRLRITAAGSPGDTLVLRHAEVLEDGELSTRPLRSADATDRYLLRGSANSETWEPRFTMHGFRYAELSGPERVKIDDIEALVYHTDMERIGWFESSNPLLNRLHDNVAWSMRGNFVDLPTDCPQRDERLGWTGDIAVFAPTAAFLYDCAGLLASWLRDLAVEQRRYGTVPYYVPWIPQHAFPFEPAAVWGDAAVLVPWALYERTGDVQILARQYASMAEWVDQVLALTSPSGLWDTGFQFGDWLDPSAPPDRPGRTATDPYLVANAFLVHSLDIMARVAELLDRHDDADRWSDAAALIRKTFAARFVTASGRLANDSQTAYTLALTFDLFANEDQRQTAGHRLAELVEATGFRIATGFVGTPLICDALTEAGYVDHAYRLLLQTECPSWLYPVTMGATTIWERWDSMLPDGRVNPGQMTSFNHYALGAVADWLHRTVAGLAPAEPAYRTIDIRPRPGGGLTSASARHRTPYGIAESSWLLDGDRFQLDVIVPHGTTARIVLPFGETSHTAGPGHVRLSCPVH